MVGVMAEQEFWSWFVRHEDELFNFDPRQIDERERIFDALATVLNEVDADLAFEFGPNGESKREFVISAGGIKKAFPAVISLANAAPQLGRWRVIAFRPRRWPINVVELGSKRVDPKDVQFSLLDNGEKAGISLFIPGFVQGDVDFKQIGYLLLDEALGEYDVETRLGPIEMLPREASLDGNRYPLLDLPVLFDQLVSRLEGRSGKSS